MSGDVPISNLGAKKLTDSNRDHLLGEEDYQLFMDEYEKVKNRYGDKIACNNLSFVKDIEKEIEQYSQEPLYNVKSSMLVARPNGEKTFFVEPFPDWDFGFAQDKIEIYADDKLFKFIDSQKQVHKEILEIAKDKSIIDFGSYEVRLLKKQINR